MRPLLILLCYGALFPVAHAQLKQPPPLRVYLDRFTPPISSVADPAIFRYAEPALNGTQYLRTVFPYVNYTDRPSDCDVRIQLTEEPAGNGSYRYVLFFYGEKQFAGQNDTVFCIIPPLVSNRLLADQMVQTLKQGLLPYLLQTPWADQIKVTFGGEAENPLFRSYWNRSTWYLSAEGSFRNIRAQSKSTDQGFNSLEHLRANTVQLMAAWWNIGQQWRFESDLRFQYQKTDLLSESSFLMMRSLDEISTVNARVAAVRRLSEHWSAGVQAYWNGSQTLSVPFSSNTLFTGGLEYNVFRYRDFFRRRLIAAYYLRSPAYTAYPKSNRGVAADHFSHILYIRYAQRFKRSWVELAPGGSLRFSRRFWNVWETGAQVTGGVELRRNFFINVSGTFMRTNDRGLQSFSSTLPAIYTNAARETYHSIRIGFIYVLGSGYRNILNPGFYPLSDNITL